MTSCADFWACTRKTTPAGTRSIALLGSILDTRKDGLISFAEFSVFEGLLSVFDALYRTAFQLFDTRGMGLVSFDVFGEVIKQTVLHKKMPFNFDCYFVKMYFGKDKIRTVTYHEFSQFLYDFHEEHVIQAFQAHNIQGSGFIFALDFADIMMSTKSHLLNQHVQDNLEAAASWQKVSYPLFMAFNSLLTNMELVKRIYLNATQCSRSYPGGYQGGDPAFFSKMSQITPLEEKILYHLTELISQAGGRIIYSDLEALTPE